MLNRKITSTIEEYFRSFSNKMMIIDGARQIGKSYIIRQVGQSMFKNYIEVNMEEDKVKNRLFADTTSVERFYLALSSFAGNKMGNVEDTLVFIDEIQVYPHLLTLTKFLMESPKFTFIASGSLLGVTLKNTQSIPIGSIIREHMYPLDFEEFLWANGVGSLTIDTMRQAFANRQTLPDFIHVEIMDYFRKYLLIGGMPDAINAYMKDHNIMSVRKIQSNIYELYKLDASKYESDSSRILKIQRIYDIIPSCLESRLKRIVIKDIEGVKGKRTSSYQDEFDYLFSSGIALEVDAISKPSYPLVQNAGKNLLKIYLNDVGIFTGLLYRNDIMPILRDSLSVNLGAVYETVVAQELKAHGFKLYYYDNKKKGEVDYLIDDTENQSCIPIEVKSGKDYYVHSALNHFLDISEYRIRRAIVLSNENQVYEKNGITYMPIYNAMFFSPDIPLELDRLMF